MPITKFTAESADRIVTIFGLHVAALEWPAPVSEITGAGQSDAPARIGQRTGIRARFRVSPSGRADPAAIFRTTCDTQDLSAKPQAQAGLKASCNFL